MKTISRVLLTGASLFVSLNLLQAQTQFTGQAISVGAEEAQPVVEATDETSAVLQALTQITPQPATAMPEAGNFYTFQHGQDWPPLPGNVLNLPFWPLGDGFFVLDDRNVDYAELQAAAEAAAALDAAAQLKTGSRGGGMSPMFSLISSPGNDQVYLTNMVAVITNNGTTASFSIAGGTNGFAYDIYSTSNLTNSPVYSQWNWLGQGYTSNSYTFTNQPLDYAFYILAIPRQTMVVAWGDDNAGQTDVPAGLTNAIDVAGGYIFSVALKADGTVIGWGDNTYGQTNIPSGLTNVTAIAAGGAHVLALRQDGTVTAWGANGYGQINVPAGLTNVTAIAAGFSCSLALRNDGSVVAWGQNTYGQTNVPAVGPVKQVAAGNLQGMALLTNGTVTAWGYSIYGWNLTNVPAGLSNVVAISAGDYHCLALQANGTVQAWGAGTGATNSAYDNLGQSIVPTGLSNVVAVAGGALYSLALQSNGTVVAWGDAGYGEMDVPDRMTGVKAIAAGGYHGLAIRSGSLTPVITQEPQAEYTPVGGTAIFLAAGTGVAGVSFQWQFNGVNISGATSSFLTLTNVQTTNEGSYQVVISNSAGSVTSDAAGLYVVTPPVLVSQSPMPTNQVAVYQTNLTLSVAVSAPYQANGFPLHYQWQFNGTNVGANSSNYTFLVDAPTLGNYSVTVTNAAGSVTSLVWQVTMTYAGSYIDVGTLAYHLSTNAVARTNGFSSIYNAEQPLANWSYVNFAGTNLVFLTNAVWSTNFWLKGAQGLSATAIGISNNLGGQKLITMISPRHYLRAYHTGIPSSPIAFLDTNNVIYWRSVVQQVDIGTNTDDIQAKDTSVGILDADLPPSVGFLPMIPTNFASYLPTNSTSYVQGIGMNQSIAIFGQPMTFQDPLNINWNSSKITPFGLTTDWNATIVPGDSSNPEMFFIGNQLVLVSHNHTSGYGPNYAYIFDVINQKMHYLSTNNPVGTNDYQLTPFSLTNWPVIH